MTNDSRRITLLSRGTAAAAHSWNVSTKAPNHVILVDTVSMLPWALDNSRKDVDRVVIDCNASEIEFLELLSCLPLSFMGDVLYMRSSGSSFLSATGRGGDRLIYALTPRDLEFYLETNQLLAA